MTELETMQRAKMYMDKLARGIDPITNQDMPEDSVLNQIRLARCFLYVSDVLGQVIANGGVIGANVKKKVGQCLKKIRPPALEKNQATWPQNA